MNFVYVYKTKVGNASKTLDKTIKLSDIYHEIRDAEVRRSFSHLLPFGELNFWDFGVRATAQLKQSDLLKIVCESICYTCELIEIIKDEEGELGDLFGWARQFKAPWSNVCALIVHRREKISEKDLRSLKEEAIGITSSFFRISKTLNKEQPSLFEGKSYDIVLSKYERSSEARSKCISHFGPVCQICNINFYKTYGELGKGFIHVHHKIPLATIRENYQVDPITDLIPVCPNCHAMLHTKRSEVLTIEDLKNIYEQNMA